ncbi:MAG TPA: hypothetical protein VEJ87_16305 [Acidimicrobiales bacterium]|nr:hypothetical protein [Acidimicrobiales bacterium]
MHWADLLEHMEDRLAAHDFALRSGAAPPQPIEIPADIGPLPIELRDRAQCVLDATKSVAERVAEARDQVAQSLREGSSSESRRPAAYLDRRV